MKVNHTLDLQRNRVETALALKQAMDEADYKKSRAILAAQVEKIKASVSAQDPFCQQLINDLKHRYRAEHDYRAANLNLSIQQSSERGTYTPQFTTSAYMYQTPTQQCYVAQQQSKRPKHS